MAYLNNPIIFDWLKCNGIVKGNIVEFSEKPIASIPFRIIDWNNPQEVFLHNTITEMTQQYINAKNEMDIVEINQLFNQLFKISS